MNKILMLDFRNIISAKIISFSPIEGELLSSELTAFPIFSRKAKIILNIIDKENQTSNNFEAYILSVYRLHGKWVYRASWRIDSNLLENICS